MEYQFESGLKKAVGNKTLLIEIGLELHEAKRSKVHFLGLLSLYSHVPAFMIILRK